MNNISEIKDICTGCSACAKICPIGAIKMVENNEGFQEPRIDHEKCTNCGKCAKICPSLNRHFSNTKLKDCYAVWNNEAREKSSSAIDFLKAS